PGRAGPQPHRRLHRPGRGARHAPPAPGQRGVRMSADGQLSIRTEQDVVLARQAARQAAVACGLRLVDQTKLITAASELARNAVVYGGGGSMSWRAVKDGMRKGVRLEFVDQGPGIPDIDQALTDGWTSGNG